MCTIDDTLSANNHKPREDAGIFKPHCPVQEPLTAEDKEMLNSSLLSDGGKTILNDEISIKHGWIPIPQLFFSQTFILFAITLGCVFALLIAVQILAFIELIARNPVWVQAPLCVLIFVIIGMILYASFRIVRFYRQMSLSPRISLSGLKRLSEIKNIRNELQNHQVSEAKEQLSQYVADYPIEDTPFHRNEFAQLNFSEGEFTSLFEQKKRLLDKDCQPSDSEWIDDFSAKFLFILDKCADKKIRYYMWRVGMKTAIVPNALIDTLVVLYCSLAMLGDLCKIYNLKMDKLSTAVVLGRIFIYGYIAGEAEEATESLVEELTTRLSQGLGQKTVNAIAPKAIEGAANAFLVRRLGKTAKKLLQPVTT